MAEEDDHRVEARLTGASRGVSPTTEQIQILLERRSQHEKATRPPPEKSFGDILQQQQGGDKQNPQSQSEDASEPQDQASARQAPHPAEAGPPPPRPLPTGPPSAAPNASSRIMGRPAGGKIIIRG